jgi:predicted PurR-regulated permease PerM
LWADTFGRLATRAGQLLLVLAVIALVLYLAVRLQLLMVPCLIALIVAAALQPLMGLLKPRMPHGLAAAITLLLGGVGLGGLVAYVVVSAHSRLGSVQSAVVKGLQQAVDYLHSGALPFSDTQIADIQHEVVNFMTSKQFGAEAVAGAYGAAQLVLSFVLSLFTCMHWSCCWRSAPGPSWAASPAPSWPSP